MIRAFLIRIFAITLAVSACMMVYRGTHAQGRDVPQVMLVVAYKDHTPVTAQAIGFAPTLSDCQAGLQAELADAGPREGITFVAVCTPLPPAPSAH